MKDVVTESMNPILDTMKDIGKGILMITKGILMVIFKSLILWCAIWWALGSIMFELAERVIQKFNSMEFARHYEREV